MEWSRPLEHRPPVVIDQRRNSRHLSLVIPASFTGQETVCAVNSEDDSSRDDHVGGEQEERQKPISSSSWQLHHQSEPPSSAYTNVQEYSTPSASLTRPRTHCSNLDSKVERLAVNGEAYNISENRLDHPTHYDMDAAATQRSMSGCSQAYQRSSIASTAASTCPTSEGSHIACSAEVSPGSKQTLAAKQGRISEAEEEGVPMQPVRSSLLVLVFLSQCYS